MTKEELINFWEKSSDKDFKTIDGFEKEKAGYV